MDLSTVCLLQVSVLFNYYDSLIITLLNGAKNRAVLPYFHVVT